jgi:predicted  nucleic acid-binding Zn-ribbon protein
MTDDNHAHQVQDLQELVSQIVHLREQMKQVEADKQRAQEQVNACSTQLLGLKSQMKETRNLLDHCLDTGEDVTAVKLTKTIQEITPRKKMLTETDWDMLDKYERTYMNTLGRTFKFTT